MKTSLLLLSVVIAGCQPCAPSPPLPSSSLVQVTNATGTPTTVYVAFGSDSVVNAATWASFCAGSGLVCAFDLDAHQTVGLPTGGSYLNATLSFGGPVGCGRTKVELNLDNPGWYDVVDLSLVDGFSSAVLLAYNDVTLGPVTSASGNEQALGVYPLGCDLCVSRSTQTPCGMTPGTQGCKAGTQYDPAVACQYQGVRGGGARVLVTYLGG